MSGLLLGFPDYGAQARALAQHAGLVFREIGVHHFPDGESRLRLPEKLPHRVVICQTLDHPNEKLVDLLLAAAGARELGAQEITLVAPYLCYMRQDKAFHPGEVVSQRHIGALLARYFDRVVTVDAHLHRIADLGDVMPEIQALNLSPSREMARFIRQQLGSPCLIGPDSESCQWVEAIASEGDFEFAVARKQRSGDRQVRVLLPALPLQGRDVLLLDDVASTGHTLEQAVQAALGQGAAEVSVLVTHALFVEEAETRLRDAGVSQIWSCDSVPHASNAISLATLLADAIRA